MRRKVIESLGLSDHIPEVAVETIRTELGLLVEFGNTDEVKAVDDDFGW